MSRVPADAGLLAVLREGIVSGTPRALTGLRASARAAVAVVLREDAALGLSVLLIERATREGDPWSGHMALPGGRHEPDDASSEATALRETREECGLDLGGAMVLGRLSDEQARTHRGPFPMAITPVVYALDAPEPPKLVLDPREVRSTLWVPVAALLEGRHDSRMTWRKVLGVWPIRLACWRYDGKVIWGLTYRMLRRLLGVAEGGAP